MSGITVLLFICQHIVVCTFLLFTICLSQKEFHKPKLFFNFLPPTAVWERRGSLWNSMKGLCRSSWFVRPPVEFPGSTQNSPKRTFSTCFSVIWTTIYVQTYLQNNNGKKSSRLFDSKKTTKSVYSLVDCLGRWAGWESN